MPQHESSNIPGGGGGTDGGTGPGSQAHESNSPNGGGTGGSGDTATGNGAHSGQTNQAKGGDSGQGKAGSDRAGTVGNGKALNLTATPTSETSDGGSSPLVPILIAIVVLAAISIGAYYYRQRRQPGSSVSPNAS